ncbi:HAMP domain-containing sensor histidine kinase [Cellulosilyticum sp. I15G10I2]|uniref:HAMP domain-containing sensor histidine kinase n=1 Tax=Cellulosilyticum sp. I15G10I2 TaxID=1892843 RepID=UPI00085BEBF4|nr:HAMP domain-containing sensor histidine kinase [Cellulosilyticum sp. I15G10I2]
MKNKIILPVMLMLWIIGLIIIGESLLLFNEILKNNSSYGLEYASYSSLFYRLIGILFVGSILLYLILLKVIHKIASPIEQLTKDAKLFAKGNYTHKLRNYEIEELQLLASAFDNMGEELNGTIRKLRHQKTKVESVLASLDEGIIVIDKEGQITEFNGLAGQMLNLKAEKSYKNHIVTLIRGNQFRKLIDDALNKFKYGAAELTLGDKIVYTTIVPVEETHNVYEYLIVLRDITKLKNLEEMKYQFVSNVSHEIKTPLTSIQGFVETLKEGAIEDKNVALRFLNIIDIEAKRLYRLIQDILLLSEIENMEKQNYGIAKVNQVIMQVMEILKEEAHKKNIELIFNDIDEIVLENTSTDHIEQVMLNLVSNAIKYTDHGCVIITTEIKNNKNVIRVRDTGIGMAKESIEHIFERFYRVDKGRSRKSGGTGLGLSIVKHIVQLYGAQIQVESEEGEGTIFTLTF